MIAKITCKLDERGKFYPPAERKVETLDDVRSNNEDAKTFARLSEVYEVVRGQVETYSGLDNVNVSRQYQGPLEQPSLLGYLLLGRRAKAPKVDEHNLPLVESPFHGYDFGYPYERLVYGDDKAPDRGRVVFDSIARNGILKAKVRGECAFEPDKLNLAEPGHLIEGLLSMKADPYASDELSARSSHEVSYARRDAGIERYDIVERFMSCSVLVDRQYDDSEESTEQPPIRHTIVVNRSEGSLTYMRDAEKENIDFEYWDRYQAGKP
jgi:hypothetical protein